MRTGIEAYLAKVDGFDVKKNEEQFGARHRTTRCTGRRLGAARAWSGVAMIVNKVPDVSGRRAAGERER